MARLLLPLLVLALLVYVTAAKSGGGGGSKKSSKQHGKDSSLSGSKKKSGGEKIRVIQEESSGKKSQKGGKKTYSTREIEEPEFEEDEIVFATKGRSQKAGKQIVIVERDSSEDSDPFQDSSRAVKKIVIVERDSSDQAINRRSFNDEDMESLLMRRDGGNSKQTCGGRSYKKRSSCNLRDRFDNFDGLDQDQDRDLQNLQRYRRSDPFALNRRDLFDQNEDEVDQRRSRKELKRLLREREQDLFGQQRRTRGGSYDDPDLYDSRDLQDRRGGSSQSNIFRRMSRGSPFMQSSRRFRSIGDDMSFSPRDRKETRMQKEMMHMERTLERLEMLEQMLERLDQLELSLEEHNHTKSSNSRNKTRSSWFGFGKSSDEEDRNVAEKVRAERRMEEQIRQTEAEREEDRDHYNDRRATTADTQKFQPYALKFEPVHTHDSDPARPPSFRHRQEEL